MSEAEQPPAQPKLGWREIFRSKAIDVVVLGLPVALFGKIWDLVAASILGQPWQAAWFLIPLVVLAAAVWLMLRRTGQFKLNWRSRVFLLLYVTVFSGAAVTNLLNWSRSLTVLGTPAPRNWLTPVWAGDWRYLLVRKTSALAPKLAIVTTPDSTGRPREETRFEMARLVKIAAAAGAKGIAFDFYLDKDSRVDSVLCSAIGSAEIPVILGHSFSRTHDEVVPGRLPDGIRKCLPAGILQGHLAGFRDPDRVVRFIPLFFGTDQARPALSLRIARQLSELAVDHPPVETPLDGLLRFVEPAAPHLMLTYADLTDRKKAAVHQPMLLDRFVLVGEDSPRELLHTPFGDKLGVEIHADAVHSLRHRSYIRTIPWWASALTILVICYFLTVLAARGVAARRLIALAVVLSTVLFALAAAAMLAAQVWVDVVYPVAALWLLIPLLLGFRRAALA